MVAYLLKGAEWCGRFFKHIRYHLNNTHKWK